MAKVPPDCATSGMLRQGGCSGSAEETSTAAKTGRSVAAQELQKFETAENDESA